MTEVASPTVWPRNTRVQLCRVPWDSDYRDVVSWGSRGDQTSYFDALASTSVVTTNVSYLRYNAPIRLPLDINTLMQYNYVVVSNDVIPDGTRRNYYYFITGAQYIAPNTTLVTLQLDVWNTWLFDVEFGRSYVMRGHVGIADVTNDVSTEQLFGQRALTIQEGLDTGSMLPITYQVFNPLVSSKPAVMVTSTIDLTADAGDVSDPHINMSDSSLLELGGDVGTTYFFDDVDSVKSMVAAFKNKPWIMQGITNITLLPNDIVRVLLLDSYQTEVVTGDGWRATVVTSGIDYKQPLVGSPSIIDFRNSFKLPNRYKNLKKLLTFPYASIEISNLAGQSLVIHPERVFHKDLNVSMIYNISPTQTRFSFFPQHYNNGGAVQVKGGANDVWIDNGEGLNATITIDNLPRMAVASNAGLMYMASNAHSLAYAQQSANWSQSKALQGNQLGYNQAGAGIDATYKQNANNINALNQTNQLNRDKAMQAGIAGVAGSALSGDVAGIVSTTINTGVAYDNINRGSAISASQMNTATDIAAGLSGYNRDTNKAYSDMAAKGDYENVIAGINARVQDSQLVAPSVIGATGGDGMNMLYRMFGILVRYKQVDSAAMRTSGEYWLRYGYAVQQFIQPPADLHCMRKFTYWKMAEVHTFSKSCSEETLNVFRAILEKGVTVWRSANEIGRIDYADNDPITDDYLKIAGAFG